MTFVGSPEKQNFMRLATLWSEEAGIQSLAAQGEYRLP